ncbi:PHP domain-containing protein [Candidatus Halobonum tyrrellensis]|uniref:PHP domain protein n=1 Tax=Candidatus Halobonum tyrrellensis G22 TaxID=1324957 RepID=V4HFP3_9EURY|nr:PHP domain-containing protein [Candidatus Halobonum tyrrellensis]ESP89510.1 PHP domain protein [Candidatus Halobonum tyrrellensis G22]
MVVADLHAHTTLSDGTLTLETLPAAAARAGVEAVALTDHDRFHPGLNAPVSDVGGVTVVRGIELRVETGGERVDLLGYGLCETDALRAECERLQRDRVERGQRIIEAVEAETGVDLELEPREGLGRPHVARAVAASDAPYDVDGAFEHLIGNDGPCFVARDVTPYERGRDLLADACALVGLAHPFRYDDPGAALDLCADLDAVERHYPYGDRGTDDPARVERVAREHDLLLTGGSDAHDERLGVAGLGADGWAAVRERLPDDPAAGDRNRRV